MNQITQKTLELLEQLCHFRVTDCSMSLLGDLALDSLRMVTLLVMIEDTFGIELDEGDMNPFALLTVADVIRLVEVYAERKEGQHG
ncbi:MAG: acyl carrier protein [Clostridia bacterium]|nr:acyl carrier protein [Clostridia bacterium]